MKQSRFPARTVLALALTCAATPLFAQHSYSKTVFFGDSLTDSGTFRPGLVQAVGPEAAILGRFTTNPGLVWSEFLARTYGTNADAANQGGDNHAVGGARIAEDRTSPFGAVPSLLSQAHQYLALNGGRADSGALYTVWGGANDLFAVASGLEPAAATIGSAVTTQVGIVAALEQGGARYVLVPNIPDLGKTPQFLALGPAASAGGTQLAATYNAALYAGLGHAGLRFIPLDTFNFLGEIIASPGTYGFVNVTGTACMIESSLVCSPLDRAAPDADETYVFADGVHPSTGAQRMVAQYAASVLEGPRQVALLGHVASVSGRARADQVAQQLAQRPENDGIHWWGGLRGDTLRYRHGDLFDGTAPSGLVGVGRVQGSYVVGGFAGYGRGRHAFGRSSGRFRQSEATLGGFFGWYGEAVWANAQVSCSWLRHDVDRHVVLGPATRVHSGSPDGSNLAVGVSAGLDLGNERLRHGPVASLLAQRIEVDGYSETDPSSTALVFPKQKADSLIGSLGWQIAYQASPQFAPYARLTWDHDFERGDDEVYARLQTLPGAADYAVPGLGLDREYLTATFGARTRVFGLDATVGFSATLGHAGGSNESVFVTFGGGF